MAKKKSKKKAPPKGTHNLDPQQTIHVLVPDKIAALHKDKLKSLAHVVAHGSELGLGEPPHAAVQHVQFIKTSSIEVDTSSPTWQKSIPQGC
jgi:hypothetical protein